MSQVWENRRRLLRYETWRSQHCRFVGQAGKGMFTLGLCLSMALKRTMAQTALSKKQTGEFTGLPTRVGLFLHANLDAGGCSNYKSSPTHILLSYVQLSLGWPPARHRPPATSSFLGIFYQLSNPHGKIPLDNLAKVLDLVTSLF